MGSGFGLAGQGSGFWAGFGTLRRSSFSILALFWGPVVGEYNPHITPITPYISEFETPSGTRSACNFLGPAAPCALSLGCNANRRASFNGGWGVSCWEEEIKDVAHLGAGGRASP